MLFNICFVVGFSWYLSTYLCLCNLYTKGISRRTLGIQTLNKIPPSFTPFWGNRKHNIISRSIFKHKNHQFLAIMLSFKWHPFHALNYTSFLYPWGWDMEYAYSHGMLILIPYSIPNSCRKDVRSVQNAIKFSVSFNCRT